MSKESKTARASAVKEVGTKIVISDTELIRQLRISLAQGLHVTQQGAAALLRAYDAQKVEGAS